MPKGEKNLSIKWFGSAIKCASSAAPIFKKFEWRWNGIDGVPNEDQIADVLMRLEGISGKPLRVTTGRLYIDRTHGSIRYGHDFLETGFVGEVENCEGK